MNKLLAILDDGRISKNSPELINKCNEKFTQLLEKVSNVNKFFSSRKKTSSFIFY